MDFNIVLSEGKVRVKFHPDKTVFKPTMIGGKPPIYSY